MLLLGITASTMIAAGLYRVGQKFKKKEEEIAKCWKYIDSGACRKAIDYCKALIEKYPKVPVIYYYLGLAHYNAGELDTALENFKKAEELENSLFNKISWNSLLMNEIKFYMDYAKVLRFAKKYSEALAHYSMALNSVNEDESERIKEILHEIAKTYEEIGDIDNAIKYYEELLIYATHKSYFHRKITELYKMSGKEGYRICLEKPLDT